MSEYFRFNDLPDKEKRDLAREWKSEAEENGDPDLTEDEWLKRLEGGMIDGPAGGDDDDYKERQPSDEDPATEAIRRSDSKR